MKYRKKPVVVEAICWLGNNEEAVEKFLDGNGFAKGKYVDIATLEGCMVASINDMIIKGVNGEFYPCKPDIFEKTYEKVDSATTNYGEPLFCGCGGVGVAMQKLTFADRWFVRCVRCDIQTRDYSTRDEAITAFKVATTNKKIPTERTDADHILYSVLLKTFYVFCGTEKLDHDTIANYVKVALDAKERMNNNEN